MKEGWRMVKLGEVADLQSGYTPSKDDLRTSGNYPYFKVGEMNLIENSVYLQKTSQYINNPRKIYKRGSVVFPRNGGAVYTEKKRILLKDSVIDLNTGAIIPNEKIVYNRYLYMWTCYEKFSKYDNGGGLPSLNFKKMINTEIPLPSLEEQHRIVSLLDASFEKIDTLKKNAEENLKNAKALFQQVLAQELKPKEGWVEKKLGDIFKFIDYRGSTPTKISSGIPLITAKNVRMGYLDYTIKDFISQEEYFARQSRGISRKGDLLFTTEAPLGNVALADLEEYSAGQRVITFQQYPDGININNKFYLWYLMSPNFQKNIRDLATGLTAQGIKAKILKDIVVYYPSIDEQNNIANTLDTLSEKCRRLEEVAQQTIRECDALKQSILRQAFSGEL